MFWILSSSTCRKRLAVIGGGGASGLATLRIMRERAEFKDLTPSWELCAFEARRDVGGIWLPEASSERTAYPGQEAVPSTPLYQSLTTNIPHPIMAYHDFPFLPETPLFPHASVVLQYLEQYAAQFHLRQYIRFNTRVISVRWDPGASLWRVKLSNSSEEEQFDAIAVANGHYGLPYTPSIPGLQEWVDSGKKNYAFSLLSRTFYICRPNCPGRGRRS